MRRRTVIAVLSLAASIAASGARASQPHLVIVGGLGGEEYYSDLFHRWADTLAEVGRRRLGVEPGRLFRLEEDPSRASGPAPVERSSKENVLGAVGRLAEVSSAGDLVAVVLFGHGTAAADRALFNLPGPDLSATELDAALDELSDRTVVVVVAAPASAPFVEALSGRDRVVITATATKAENQHTRFGGHFIDALADDAADTDKDGRISLLEAFRYADHETARAFEAEHLLRTEHAMLDDDGDGHGSRDPGRERGDGHLAARVHLRAPAHPAGTPAGREALALEVAARRLVDRIEALKQDKRNLAPDHYQQRLESLLIELALNRRAYRELR